jgi:hypothetical protein
MLRACSGLEFALTRQIERQIPIAATTTGSIRFTAPNQKKGAQDNTSNRRKTIEKNVLFIGRSTRNRYIFLPLSCWVTVTLEKQSDTTILNINIMIFHDSTVARRVEIFQISYMPELKEGRARVWAKNKTEK